MAVFDYIGCFHNPCRPYSALGYLSPASYERRCFNNTTAA
jgi:transposase InsO family protein